MDERTENLLKEARNLLAHMINSGKNGPAKIDCDPSDGYPVDEDGNAWYPEVWELRQAIRGFDDNSPADTYPVAPPGWGKIEADDAQINW